MGHHLSARRADHSLVAQKMATTGARVRAGLRVRDVSGRGVSGNLDGQGRWDCKSFRFVLLALTLFP